MKKTLLLILIFCSIIPVEARQRSLSEMKALAAKVLTTVNNAKGMFGNVSTTELEVVKEKEALTIIGNENGFVIIANDDDFASGVLGHCDKEFDESNAAPAMLWWLNMTNQCLSERADAASNAYNTLQELLTTSVEDAVEPLITTKWNQNEPYYNQVPLYEKSGKSYHYYTGCVATAMAQVMNYYKYPTQGIGSHSYKYPNEESPIGTLSVDFYKTTYDWAHMKDTYIKGSYTTTEATAVATLMYHCGVAVDMEYGEDGSGAFNHMAGIAFRTYFGYNKNIKYRNKDTYPDVEFINMLRESLAAKRPVIYGGSGSQGAHSFILDGYNSEGLFHVNWGWGGHDDGYFAIATMGGFPDTQEAVFVTKSDVEDAYKSYWCVDKQGLRAEKTNNSQGIKISGFIINNDITNFTGSVNIVFKNATTEKSFQVKNCNNVGSLDEKGYRYGFSDNFTVTSISGVPNGNYVVYLTTKSASETTAQVIRSENQSVTNSFNVTVSDGRITALSSNSSPYSAINNIYKVKNSAEKHVKVYDIEGRLLHESNSENFSIDDVNAKGLLIIRQGNNVRKIRK